MTTASGIPAAAGWGWIKRGFALFRKQPAELATLMFAYMFVVLALSVLPIVGAILPLLMPALSLAFLQAAVQVERGQRVYPSLLLYGLRSKALKRLLVLGALNMGAAMVAVGASTLADGGAMLALLSNETQAEAATMQAALPGFLAFAAVYVPVMMAFWYAAPLLAWQDMGVGKALFFSFVAVKRAGRAFLFYALCWGAIFTLMRVAVSPLLLLITGSALATVLVIMPILVLLGVVMLCSFYPMYTDIFGRPEQPATQAP